MKLHHYCDLISRAVAEGGSSLDRLAALMDDAAQAKQVLQLKGYGGPWDTMTKLVAKVPSSQERD